jgi:hypothetical protein
MIPDWARNLLIRSAIGAVILVALLHCVGTAGASDITVSPSSPIAVSFDFDQPIGSRDYSTDEYFTITIAGNDTITIDSVSGDNDRIRITPFPSSFTLEDGDSKSIKLTIWASSYASEGKHEFSIKVGEEQVTVTVTITWYAKIEVTPSSTIDFGRVSRTQNPSETVRISEEYGYKDVTVNLVRSGNSWVTGPTSVKVPRGGYEDIIFQLTPGTPSRNDYSWTFSLSTTTSHVKPISPSTIHLEAYILMPPKLGRLDDEKLDITFDKPKGTVSRYVRDIDVRVRNEGDEPLYFRSIDYPQSLGGGIGVEIDPPDNVPGKASRNIEVSITVPYNAPEGTYRGKLHIYAGDKDGKSAGDGEVEITLVITWPVDFTISSASPYFTSSPRSIDFDSLELKERGYETKRVNITLTEYYLYKPVRNLRFSTSGEYGNWLKVTMDFAEIPLGESRNITLRIEPGLEAVPKDYSWKYYISAYEISAKRIDVMAKIVPIDIEQMIESLDSFRESPLYRNYPSSAAIIANGIAMLEVVESSEIGADDWGKIPVLMTGTLSLLSSLNDGIVFTEAENYGNAVESLSAASVSTATLAANSNLNNRDIAGYATAISVDADDTTKAVLMDAAKLLELRGWTIKKAVEHALAIDDIAALNEEENVLEAALSYQYAAMLYGLLNDKEKRLENVYEGSVLMDKHDELVSDATDLRLRAETSIATSKEDDLTRIWDTYLLFNPYNYDTFVTSYRTAEGYLEEASQKYKVAGERFLYDQTEGELNRLKSELRFILSFFFIACGLYGVLFLYAITRIVQGTMAYMRDVYEREVGDILVTG